MSDESTAVTRSETPEMPAGAQQEIQNIRQAGLVAIERQKAINRTYRTLEGLSWGSVTGRSLSEQTRYAMAELCEITGANAQTHIDILGNRPYLNAAYWADLINSRPEFISYDQKNLSASYAETLRQQAKEAEKDGAEEEAAALRTEARFVDRRRAFWGAPDQATHVYETIIRRYTENAPLAAIRTGQISGDPFTIEVQECNWAGGGKNDPVGNAEPAKTSRTRSLRRCAVKGFSVVLKPVEDRIRKLEHAIEAEFTVIRDDMATERGALPAPGAAQAVRIGAGEPEAAAVIDAEPLPVEEPAAVKMVGNARKERDKFHEGCRVFGIDAVDQFVADTLGHTPASLEDYQMLNARLSALADGADGGGEQERLL